MAMIRPADRAEDTVAILAQGVIQGEVAADCTSPTSTQSEGRVAAGAQDLPDEHRPGRAHIMGVVGVAGVGLSGPRR